MAAHARRRQAGRMNDAIESWRSAPVAWADVGGTKLAYRRFGRGPAVVLIHGWPLSGITWRHLVARLQDRFTCIVPDLPGAGSTPWSPTIRESFADLGALVHGLTETLGLERYALVGHDSGGAMARVIAARAPDRVTAVAMTNTEIPGHVAKLVRVFQILLSLPGSRALFRALLGSETYCRSRFGFGGCFTNRDLIMGEFHQACIAPLVRDPSGAIAMLRAADLGFAHQLQAVHDRVTAPVLCVWGDRDPFFPAADARAMVDAWHGRARIEVIGGKLFVHEEHPEQVAALIEPFLLEHADRRVSLAIPA